MTDIANLISAWTAAWSAPVADPERFGSLLTDDCAYEDVPFGEVSTGRADVTDFYLRSRHAFPDFTLTPQETLVAGDMVALTWRMTGTQLGELPGLPATGHKVSGRGVSILRLEGDRVASCTDYYDTASMIFQLKGDAA